MPLVIWKFISQINPDNKKQSLKLLHKSLGSSDEGFVFIMLAKQIAKLITAKTSPEKLSGANWQKRKLHKQSDKWTLQALLEAHEKMLNIDKVIKTGKTKLDLTSHLDLLIMEL